MLGPEIKYIQLQVPSHFSTKLKQTRSRLLFPNKYVGHYNCKKYIDMVFKKLLVLGKMVRLWAFNRNNTVISKILSSERREVISDLSTVKPT